MGVCPEAVRQKLSQCDGVITAIFAYQIDGKVIIAKFPHDLPADTTRGKLAGNDAILATADRNGGEFPVAVKNGFEECGAFCADSRGKGCVFDVAALIYGAVFTQQCCAYLIAGIGHIGVGHGFLGQFDQLFRCHKQSFHISICRAVRFAHRIIS